MPVDLNVFYCTNAKNTRKNELTVVKADWRKSKRKISISVLIRFGGGRKGVEEAIRLLLRAIVKMGRVG